MIGRFLQLKSRMDPMGVPGTGTRYRVILLDGLRVGFVLKFNGLRIGFAFYGWR